MAFDESSEPVFLDDTPDTYLSRAADAGDNEADPTEKISGGGVVRKFLGKLMPRTKLVGEEGGEHVFPQETEAEREHRLAAERLLRVAVLAMLKIEQRNRLSAGDSGVLLELAAINETNGEYPRITPKFGAYDSPVLQAVEVVSLLSVYDHSSDDIKHEEVGVHLPFEQPELYARIVDGVVKPGFSASHTELLQLMAPVRRAGLDAEVTGQELEQYDPFTDRGE
jgi:hypothetical protein